MAVRSVVLVPVKPPAVGKSRLLDVGDDQRHALAAAFALDAVGTALATATVEQVLAVTDDAAFASRLTALGAHCLPDGASLDLNAALEQAAAEAARRWPDLRPAVLCADLPALRAADLEQALRAAPAAQPCFVADAEARGTTMYLAPHRHFSPRFGPGSARAHRDAGAAPLPGDLPTLRRDVDDLHDLRGARALGLGPHTAEVVRLLRLPV